MKVVIVWFLQLLAQSIDKVDASPLSSLLHLLTSQFLCFVELVLCFNVIVQQCFCMNQIAVSIQGMGKSHMTLCLTCFQCLVTFARPLYRVSENSPSTCARRVLHHAGSGEVLCVKHLSGRHDLCHVLLTPSPILHSWHSTVHSFTMTCSCLYIISDRCIGMFCSPVYEIHSQVFILL